MRISIPALADHTTDSRSHNTPCYQLSRRNTTLPVAVPVCPILGSPHVLTHPPVGMPAPSLTNSASDTRSCGAAARLKTGDNDARKNHAWVPSAVAVIHSLLHPAVYAMQPVNPRPRSSATLSAVVTPTPQQPLSILIGRVGAMCIGLHWPLIPIPSSLSLPLTTDHVISTHASTDVASTYAPAVAAPALLQCVTWTSQLDDKPTGGD